MQTKEEKEERQNKKNIKAIKNAVILLIIYIATIGITFYFCKIYNVYEEYQKEIPVIRDSLQEITKEDLEHYIVENSYVVVYMCTSPEDKCRNFEKDLKKYVKKKEITDEIVYLNLTGVDLDQFVSSFNKKYSSKLTKYLPAFAYFKDGTLETIIQEKKSSPLTISKLDSFLELVWNEEEMETLEEQE